MDTILGKRFGLRNLLVNTAHHNSTTAIPKADLSAEKEPAIGATITALAEYIVANPDLILLDVYTPAERQRDWKNLVNHDVIDVSGNLIPYNSRSRPGHNILDHYMRHFWDVRNHRGDSVRSSITVPALEKALWQNIQNHSTPYPSELRRMIINTCALGSVTKYRALTSMAIVRFFGAKRVLDPCIGWGGRLLGTLAAGADTFYVGCEPDPLTAAGLRAILADTAIPSERRLAAQILELPAETGLPTLAGPFDLILTSPPYFNMELYNGEHQSLETHSSWDAWVEGWLRPVITLALEKLVPTGTSCWSVKNIKTDRPYPLADAVKKIHNDLGYTLIKTVVMSGCGRMGVNRIGDDGKETRKSEEETFCFQNTGPVVAVVEAPPNYSILAVHALKDLWRQRGWRGFTSKSKDELVARLVAGS